MITANAAVERARKRGSARWRAGSKVGRRARKKRGAARWSGAPSVRAETPTKSVAYFMFTRKVAYHSRGRLNTASTVATPPWFWPLTMYRSSLMFVPPKLSAHLSSGAA
jgi:hypothetical protein